MTVTQPTAVAIRSASASRQVLTVFGDYWWHVDEHFPSAALVAVLADLGVADGAARATLSRLTKADVLVNDRDGRRTSYSLSSRGSDIVDAQREWLTSFGAAPEPWDGTWSAVAFSVPESERARRHQVRSRLKWLGYAPLHDGLWISPHGNERVAVAELRELGVTRMTAFRSDSFITEPHRPEDAWDLSDLEQKYRNFVDQLRMPLPSRPAEALVDRMTSILEWQSFRTADPGLPEELLPADWPRRRARELFIERYRAAAPLAEERVREHVAAIAPELASLVTDSRLD